MYLARTFLFLLITIASSSTACRDSSSKPVGLEITEQNEKFVLTVPVNRFVMTIPKGGLVRVFGGYSKDAGHYILEKAFGGPADSGYFIFRDDDLHLQVAGMFTLDSKFRGEHLWQDDQLGDYKPKDDEEIESLHKAEEVAGLKDMTGENIGEWRVLFVDRLDPGTSKLTAWGGLPGTRIELDLSLISDGSQTERRERLRDILNSIQVEAKE